MTPGGVTVDAICSGVWGRGHGSARSREVNEIWRVDVDTFVLIRADMVRRDI